jgi:hypothetical protein
VLHPSPSPLCVQDSENKECKEAGSRRSAQAVERNGVARGRMRKALKLLGLLLLHHGIDSGFDAILNG